jgi:hypothetical protein
MQQNNNHINTTNDSNESKNHEAKLKLAIIGSRGYPHVYSGYETLVKALVERLPAKGVEITVYCHAHLFPQKPAMVNGIHLVYIPTLPFKSLAQPILISLSNLAK